MDDLRIIIKMLSLRPRYDLSLGDLMLIRNELKGVRNVDEVDIAIVMSRYGNKSAAKDVTAHKEKEAKLINMFRRR